MSDADCVGFLQWCLPRLELKWSGYRKVRGTVCKRVRRRIRTLGLATYEDYQAYLEETPAEWTQLETFCRIPISRFFRDRGVFVALGDRLLPELAAAAKARNEPALKVWSAGCASGEEPYSLSILWRLRVAWQFPEVALRIIATDADETMLSRCQAGRYQPGSLRDLPPAWAAEAFETIDGLKCIKQAFREDISFQQQDIRQDMPEGPFDMILCRNLAFTYFTEPLQVRILEGLAARLNPGGYLVIGSHEKLPQPQSLLDGPVDSLPVYRKAE